MQFAKCPENVSEVIFKCNSINLRVFHNHLMLVETVKNVPISWLINREILAMEETTDVTPDTPPARKR